jgi:uncharacterized membrane protein
MDLSDPAMDRLAFRRQAQGMTTTLSSRTGSMIDNYSRGLTLSAVIGAGVVAGVYFAFATFVMPGLRRAPASSAIGAFNGINKAAPASPLFMLVLFGTGIVSVLLMIWGLQHRDNPAAIWMLVGAGLYLVSLLVTMMYHVPHNEQLMKVDPHGSGAAATWTQFYSAWMGWNWVRTVTALGGTISLVFALRPAR